MNSVDLNIGKGTKIQVKIKESIRDYVAAIKEMMGIVVERLEERGDSTYLKTENAEMKARLRMAKTKETEMRRKIDVCKKEIEILKREMGNMRKLNERRSDGSDRMSGNDNSDKVRRYLGGKREYNTVRKLTYDASPGKETKVTRPRMLINREKTGQEDKNGRSEERERDSRRRDENGIVGRDRVNRGGIRLDRREERGNSDGKTPRIRKIEVVKQRVVVRGRESGERRDRMDRNGRREVVGSEEWIEVNRKSKEEMKGRQVMGKEQPGLEGRQERRRLRSKELIIK